MATRRRTKVDRVLDWSFLDQPEEDTTSNTPYTSYRSPGRRGLGPASDFQIPEDAVPLTPEEAALELEGEPIDSRLEALTTHFSSTRDQMSADADFENLDALRKYEDPEVRSKARQDLEDLVRRYSGQKGVEGYRLQALKELDVLEEAERIFSTPGEYDKLLQEIGSKRILAGQEGRRAEEYYDRTGNIGTRTIGDVASQLESGLSILGAVAGTAVAPGAGTVVGAGIGSAPMAKIAYDSAYTEARLAGVSIEDAQNFATAMAGSEFVLEAAGGATGAKLGTTALKGAIKSKLRDFFPDLVRKRGTQALAGATGAGLAGGVEETATEGLQMFGAVVASNVVDDPEFKKFLESQAPRDENGNIDYSAAGSQSFRAGLAGFLQGATIGGGARYVSEKVEDVRRTQQAVLNNTVSDQQARETFSAAIDRAAVVSEQIQQQAKAEAPVQGELFGGESSPIQTTSQDMPAPAWAGGLTLPQTQPIYTGEKEPIQTSIPVSQKQTPSGPLGLENRAAAIRKQAEEKAAKAKAKTAAEDAAKIKAEQDRVRKETAKATDNYMRGYMEQHPEATDAEVAAMAAGFRQRYKPTPAITTPPKAPQKPSKPVSTPKATPVAQEAKPAPTPSQEVTDDTEQAEILKKIEGLSSQPKERKAVVTMAKAPTGRVKNVISSLVRSRTADTDSAVELINKGKLVIVDKEADLPDGLEKGRDGWYDPSSKRIWLVAENLSPETVRGTAVHEVNHFLNLNKAKDGKSRTGIKTLLNENEKPIIKRIETLAASGNKIAVAAKARADKAREGADDATKQFVYDNELVSYFGSEALDRISKQGVIGQAGQVLRDLKSGINTTVKKMGIQDLTDNDISYILRRQMEDAQDVEFQDTGEARESIIGERAANFNQQVQRTPERLYRGELDRRKRIEISDRGAKLSPNYKQRLEKPTFLGAVMDHKELFDNYPGQMIVEQPRYDSTGKEYKAKVRYGSMKSIQVRVSDKLPDGMSYDGVNDVVTVAKSALNIPEEKFKSYLLHEMQHAIQARENFVSGANYHRILEQERQILKNKLGTTKLPEQAELVAHQRAWTKYDRTYGEAEARLSERNFRLTEDELSEQLPEERFTERYMLDENEHVTQRLPAERTLPGTSRPVSKALDSIKAERGGNFDNQFVDKLAQALGHNIFWDTDTEEGAARVAATERMIKNYLSKWAGTKDDPLKDFTHSLFTDVDLEIRTWEDLWDKALEPLSAKDVRNSIQKETYDSQDWRLPDKAIPAEATIWGGFWNGLDNATRSIRVYLRHVRDYLATVPYQELSKYDLVRAVRETQQWDEEAKKKAEKAKVQADKNLETYIQFPDGWRWVRLNKPGQFAAESDIMGHSVRGYEPVKEDRTLTPEFRNNGAFLRPHPDWIEGAEGGHPNYGYGGWEAIKNDAARIYSLRDPKGKSQVTVELGKPNVGGPYDMDEVPGKKDKFEVSQIKGRFNASPTPDTFPKTQDLLLNLNEEELIDQTLELGDYYNAGLISDSVNVGTQADFDVALEAYVQEQRESAKLADQDVNFWNKKPATRRVERSLESSAKRKYSESSASKWDSTGMSIVRMLFDPNKGITKEGLDTRDYWRLKSGGLRELAEGYTVRINNAIKKKGVDRDEFQKAVDKAESMKTQEERERAFDGIVRSFGDAGAEYRKGRMMIDSLSKEILKDWYNEIKKTGRKASAEELRVMNSIVENVGKYSTRVYLSDIPQIGQEYAKNLMKQYDKGEGKYFKIVKDAVDYLIDHEVGIPDSVTLMRRSPETVRRTYQTWIASGEGKSKEDMIFELMEKKKELGQDEIDAMTRKVVREMLGLDNQESTSAVARYYRGAAVDKGILKEREKIPVQLRSLMGEVTDPAQKILVTISAQADLLYKNRMLNDFYDNFEGVTWVKAGDRAKAGNEKFTEKLSGEQYGPLDGMYVTKPFAYALKAVRTHTLDLKEALGMAGLDGTLPGQALAAGVARGIGKLSTAQKMSKTALDQGAWMLNGMGSPINLLKNGQLLVASKGSREAMLDAVTLALQNFGVEHKKNPETNKRLSVLLEHGIPDSVFTAELRDSEKEFYEKLLSELNSGVMTNPKKAWNKLRKGLRGVRDTYGLLDSWVKIADFYGQVDYLTEYYKANGDTVSPEQINREAADIVKFRNITYSRSPIAVQTLERSGAAIFATFASEVIRTMITTPMTIKMALNKAKEAKTAEARSIAMIEATKIGVGYTTALALIPSLSHMLLNQMFNGEDDDEKAKEERERFLKLWFESDRDQSYYVVGKNEAGATVLFNASRVDPNGHVTDFVRQAAQNDDPEEYWNNVKSLFTSAAGNGYADDAINLLMAKGPGNSNLADMAPTAQKELQDMFEEFQWDRKQADRLTRLIDNFTPGFLKVVNQQNTRIASSKDATDQAVGNLFSAVGMRMTVIDPIKIAGFEAAQFNTARATAVKQFNELMQREGIEREDIIRTALNIYTLEQDASRRLADVYSGLNTEVAGVNARKVLADANVAPEDIQDAALARYRSTVLSRSRLNEREKKQLGQAETPEAKRKLRDNYRLARQVLAELQLETR